MIALLSIIGIAFIAFIISFYLFLRSEEKALEGY